MKLLLDQNLSFKLCVRLAEVFPGTTQVRLVGLDGASDQVVWDYARVNGFALASLDSDFAEMAALLGPPPKIIWLRCRNQPTAAIENLLLARSTVIAEFLADVNSACLEIY